MKIRINTDTHYLFRMTNMEDERINTDKTLLIENDN